MGSLVPTCVWMCSDELVAALDSRFGPPVDAYVNGSQVWLRDDGPGGETIEWRLHPVAGYSAPAGLGTYDIFDQVSAAIAAGAPPPAPVRALWDGLEAFPAYGDEVEPATLSSSCAAALGLAPAAVGLVDHQRIGDSWERSSGGTSIIDALVEQLRPRASD